MLRSFKNLLNVLWGPGFAPLVSWSQVGHLISSPFQQQIKKFRIEINCLNVFGTVLWYITLFIGKLKINTFSHYF